MKLTTTHIQAIGNFLAAYHSDLTYINCFDRFKKNKITISQFSIEGVGSFKTYLNEFKIVRNIPAGSTHKLLEITKEWISEKSRWNKIDEFAELLKSHGLSQRIKNSEELKIPHSLASKVLFLNDPVNVFPNDRYARAAVNCNDRRYSVYIEFLRPYVIDNYIEINSLLRYINKFTGIIEKDFPNLENIETIRYNRFLDKMLWTIGK